MQYPVVTIKTSHGTIEMELYPDIAPNTVNNFISLVKKGFYDGTTFHRIIPKFMIQGGDPKGTGTGGPGYRVVSMARTVNPNSAGSQFFIMVDDAPYLDGEYAAFGRVTSGMEEVDRIVSVPRDYDDKPLEEEKIETVTVETFGETYAEPKKV